MAVEDGTAKGLALISHLVAGEQATLKHRIALGIVSTVNPYINGSTTLHGSVVSKLTVLYKNRTSVRGECHTAIA